MTPNGRHLGAHKSPHDPRDHSPRTKANLPAAGDLPPLVDLRATMPPIWNQGALGSCEAHGAARALAAMYPGFMPSRLAMYYDARALEGNIAEDAGVQTRSMMKVAARGAFAEEFWEYEPAKFAQAPPVIGPEFRIGSYSALANRADLLGWIAMGNPAVFALDLPTRMDGPEAAEHGVVTLDVPGTVGWHCMCAVGYDLQFKTTTRLDIDPALVDDEVLIVANSWGEEWGDAGHCYIPVSYVLGTNGGDAWALHTIPAAGVNS